MIIKYTEFFPTTFETIKRYSCM